MTGWIEGGYGMQAHVARRTTAQAIAAGVCALGVSGATPTFHERETIADARLRAVLERLHRNTGYGGHMESDDVFLTCDCDLSAFCVDSIALRAYSAPGADWRARRIGYGSWRDPYRTAS